jgi:hypothetical protein
VIRASQKFGGVPIFLGECSFGSGPASGVVWSDTEWTVLSNAFFEVLAPLECWAGVNWWRWPYDNPDGTAASLPASLLAGLSAGWTAGAYAPTPSPLTQLGPRTPRPRQARVPTVLSRGTTKSDRSRRR